MQDTSLRHTGGSSLALAAATHPAHKQHRHAASHRGAIPFSASFSASAQRSPSDQTQHQIPVYGLAALTTPTELLLLSCYFGFLYGALQSYSRAVFASLVPPPEAARFFALYSITDKSSSFIGPALVALIADRTRSVRAGFVFLVIALVLPLPLLARVNVEKGAEDAAVHGSES